MGPGRSGRRAAGAGRARFSVEGSRRAPYSAAALVPAVRQRIQRFEIVAELGTGGTGTVFRARDPQLQREVAIKVLALRGDPPPGLSSVRTVDLRAPATSREDLLDEARIMAQLSH